MKQIIYLFFILSLTNLRAQEGVKYQKPPQEILELVDVPMAPYVTLDENKSYMVMLFRDAYKTIEDLSQEELRLGG